MKATRGWGTARRDDTYCQQGKTWIPCGGHVLEQNSEWGIEDYWLLYEEVRGEHEICMDRKSSNIGYPLSVTE